jgi:hypothetical protein
VMAPQGRLRLVLVFTIAEGGITGIDVVADRERLEGIEVALLDVPWTEAVGADD